SMEQAVDLLVRLTGLTARALRPGPRTVRALAAAMNLVGKVAQLPPLYSGETLRSIAGTSFTATSAKAERELGFTPRGLAAGSPPRFPRPPPARAATPRPRRSRSARGRRFSSRSLHLRCVPATHGSLSATRPPRQGSGGRLASVRFLRAGVVAIESRERSAA